MKMLILALVLPTGSGCAAEESEEEWLKQLSEEIRLHEATLLSHADGIRKGTIERQKGFVTFPSPKTAGARKLQISGVTMDQNGNVYFVLQGSSVVSNVGIVNRVPGTELLGDQMEPRMKRQELLFGDWWLYTSN